MHIPARIYLAPVCLLLGANSSLNPPFATVLALPACQTTSAALATVLLVVEGNFDCHPRPGAVSEVSEGLRI
tara:strand:- start:3361 stop:3576 length:216 start_codon:yes stop_codon:yes gene_type:complete